jgi:uncharacterized Zn finger protein (UPF0148 family)
MQLKGENMDTTKYNRQIELLCPTCGNTQFEYKENESEGTVKCTSCNRELTRDELLRENEELISESQKEIIRAAAKDAANELKKIFKRKG